MENVHEGILRKFESLKGKLLIGKTDIKGKDSEKRLPPDQFVSEPHILHDLIRGFYKPAGKPYLLSYQATESELNYGKQIEWDDSELNFRSIKMLPPSGEKDNRKKSDIEAARYNLRNQIPIGILHKVNKGQNRILGLGMIVSENEDGVFCIEPYSLPNKPDSGEELERDVPRLDLSDLEVINHIFSYIKNKGFYYEREEVINLFLSLKTKPFVILSGISGTGKTMMIKWFAEALGATNDNGRFTLIPVRPDWSDGSELLGYRDIKGEFIQGPLTKVLKRAAKDNIHSYFILLDEMNLARVEYYFSDFLSVMESRVRVNGKLITHPVLPKELTGEILGIPENVYIIGTVNMDETTHPFSKKVLDRANTVEFNRVVLDNFLYLENQERIEPINIDNSKLVGPYIHLKDAFKNNKDLIQKVTDELIKVNAVLESIGAHIGYRVRDEICFYMVYNSNEKLMGFNDAFDLQLLQKILPRLSGSDYQIYSVLKDLYTCCTDRKVNDDQLDSLYHEIKDTRYPRSAKKLADMLRRYNEDGFTSFWLGS